MSDARADRALLTGVLDDLRDESEELDRLVGDLTEEQWALPTPAPGWTLAHQVAHLAWTDEAALLAATDPEAFAERAAAAAEKPDGFVDDGAREGAALLLAALLARWRAGRD
ncbi:maleylpyruvate isomerase N-terminal domain-containing protein, partial [Streptomyces longispororuber]|uniref:maleylpyruvate isomerase N-terminal domain-containing protein n=1 Tax=Streptomyces longispororuber TaxID=68230 RepID=UPI001E50E33A